MNATCWTSSRPRRTGLTLIEVVAGLALLSMLLVAVLTTRARVMRQSNQAARTLEAVAAADRLLANWWQDLERFPRSSSGRVPDAADLRWRTTPVPNPLAESLSTSVVRLEILEERRGARTQAVLTSVEIVLDDERPRPPADAFAEGAGP